MPSNHVHCGHQWRIQDGAFGANAPLPCGGAILLIKILNFVKPRLAYKIHENMYILLAIITNSPETKVNQSETNCHQAPSCVLSASKNNYRVAAV